MHLTHKSLYRIAHHLPAAVRLYPFRAWVIADDFSEGRHCETDIARLDITSAACSQPVVASTSTLDEATTSGSSIQCGATLVLLALLVWTLFPAVHIGFASDDLGRGDHKRLVNPVWRDAGSPGAARLDAIPGSPHRLRL
jgi:hypothetical protein